MKIRKIRQAFCAQKLLAFGVRAYPFVVQRFDRGNSLVKIEF